MNAYITTKEELNETVAQAVKELFKQELPSLIRRATRKDWLTTNELMELTGWSRRTIQYLRDKKRIPFSQEGRRILYPINGSLHSNQVKPLGEEMYEGYVAANKCIVIEKGITRTFPQRIWKEDVNGKIVVLGDIWRYLVFIIRLFYWIF